ncbi:hypothetical protein EW146_g1791 [Bondarzewia mesenterica]|uniref:Pyridoxamine 5'-phosphate oxidase Alr4036 family FMN-binding domain-containing protein n=1 Tax=Bondarzewia mesenterica TaxID=1095465 RepID=A0A4S4M2U2_9AGAM|nr:hypothetical protein EW146_g1791 [Bondarzewia mesenterica]
MSSAPRWFNALGKAYNDVEKSSIYQLATTDSFDKPHVRSHVHRAFLTPPSYLAIPLLLTTTDVRSPKVAQIAYSNTVELSWWIEGSSDQFRITGRARVIPAPEYAPKLVSANDDGCTAIASLDKESFNWEAKRQEVFENISRHIRAGFCAPVPGSVLNGGYDEQNDWVDTVENQRDARTDEEKKNTAKAFGNFALIVIEPFEVDWVQMGVTPNRRTRFRREGDAWEEQVIVP